MSDQVDRMIERLILDGAMEVAGLDADSGQFLYSFTPKMAELYPELNKMVTENIDQAVMLLWVAGFLDIKDLDTDSPMVSMTDLCNDEEALSKLEPSLRSMLKTIRARFEQE